MKVLVILSVLFVASHATPLVYSAPPIIGVGGSTQYNAADSVGNYNFGYDEGHLSGGTFRKESGDAFGNKYGSYGLRDADGRVRVVNYVADANGFRADIKSNEPGVEPKDPANTYINKAAVIAPAVTYAAAPIKAYAAPLIAPALTYAAAPVKTISSAVTYAAAPFAKVPFQIPGPPFGFAAPEKTIASAVTYAAAPLAKAPFQIPGPPFGFAAPITSYAAPVAYAAAPAAYVAAPTVYKGTPFVAAPTVYKGTPFVRPAIAV